MRLGVSSKLLRDYPLEKAIAIAHRFGYAEIEFWVDDLLTSPLSVDEIIRLTDACGIGRCVHLRTEDLNLASFNEPIRLESLRQQKEGLELAARLDARTATLHPGRKIAKTRTAAEAWEKQLESLDALAAHAENCGVVLCVEAMEQVNGEFVLNGGDLNYIREQLKREMLAFTLDLSHLHTIGDVCRELKAACGLPVKNVHISQSRGKKPHLPLFEPEGEIDFRAAFVELNRFYDGPLIVEGYVPGQGVSIVERSMQWYRTIIEERQE